MRNLQAEERLGPVRAFGVIQKYERLDQLSDIGGLTRRVIGPRRWPRVASAIRRAPAFAADSVAFATSKRGAERELLQHKSSFAFQETIRGSQHRAWRGI
jgi:hypothetical protein